MREPATVTINSERVSEGTGPNDSQASTPMDSKGEMERRFPNAHSDVAIDRLVSDCGRTCRRHSIRPS
jgi:hypothetical protein